MCKQCTIPKCFITKTRFHLSSHFLTNSWENSFKVTFVHLNCSPVCIHSLNTKKLWSGKMTKPINIYRPLLGDVGKYQHLQPIRINIYSIYMLSCEEIIWRGCHDLFFLKLCKMEQNQTCFTIRTIRIL